MVGRTLGNYQVIDKLGAGGMGEVWRATDTTLGREVAIKVLTGEFARDPERLARLEREARVLAALNHPNIAAIYGMERAGETPFLVLELVPGPTLAERLGTGPLEIDEALRVGIAIAEALEAAHEKTIIHRDLKPANIKITPEGKVKVLDFGLAKALTGEPVEADRSQSPTLTAAATRAGVILGTAAYMSPEQARGLALDKRTDIWAFGCVLYEMVAGRQPFQGGTVMDVLSAVVRAAPDWSALPEATPASMRVLLERCLQKEAGRRLRDIGDARMEMEAALAGGAQPQAQAQASQPVRAARRWRWVAGAAAAGVVAGGLGMWGWTRRPAPEVRQIRFTVPAQERLRSLSGFMAASPDGRRLAYASADASGRRRLWVRALDSTVARALARTEDAEIPFWSPDSRFLAFFARGKLWKVEAAGDAAVPEVVCEATDAPLGGSWSRDGVIVFAPTTRGGLHQVSAAGGVSKVLTSVPQEVLAHAAPQFLPDGKRFLYYAYAPGAGKGWLFVASLDGKLSKRVTEGWAIHATTPAGQGYLLFPRGGTLRAQLFDEQRLELSGEAQTVAGAQVAPMFTVNGGVLAYREAADTRDRELVWFDRAGRRLSVVGEKGDYMMPRLSPDGKRLAVERHGGQGGGDIYVFELAGGNPARLTFDAANHNAFVAWSPDGRRMVFHSTRQGGQLLEKAGAGNEEPAAPGQPAGTTSDWSQDGRFVVYDVIDPKTRTDIWLLPMTGERKPAPLLATKFHEMQGQFSPDGRWIAYASDESGQFEVYVRPFPSGGEQWRVSTGGGDSPRWRRDGKEVFYLAPDGKIMAVPVTAGSTLQTGPPQALFQSQGLTSVGVLRQAVHWDVTADGQRFLVVAPEVQAAGVPITVVVNWHAGLRP